jgi:hypothetical protein
MSYSASPSAGYRIAIGATIGRAYGSVFGNWRLAVGFAWLPVALVVGAEAIVMIVGGSGFVGRTLSSMTGIIGFLLFGTTFAVRWCRFILLGERQSGELFPPGWRLMMVVTVKFCLITLAGAVIVLLIARHAPHPLRILIWALGGLAIVLLSPRFFLAFPGAAIERPLALRASWDRIKGDYWRFLACVVMCYLPLAMIAELIGRAGAATAFGAVWIAIEVVRLAVTFIDIAVLYGLLAEVYRGVAGAGTDEAAAD